MEKSMNSTTLTEMTDEQAQAILDMLAQKVGYRRMALAQISYDMYMPKVENDAAGVVTKLAWLEFKRGPHGVDRIVRIQSSDKSYVECLRSMLEICADGHDIDIVYHDILTMKRTTLLKAGTSLEELLVQLDLEGEERV